MADRERRHLSVDLNERLDLLRPKLVAALDAMDYKLALYYQLENRRPSPPAGLSPVVPQTFLLDAASRVSAVHIISKRSRQSRPVGERMFFAAEQPDARAATEEQDGSI